MMKERNSSFELLRILLIFMVCLEHANFWYFGVTSSTNFEYFVRCFLQSLCVPAVNAFVLISGWFGIRGDYKRVFPVLFQLAICTLPFALVFFVMGEISLQSLDDFSNYFLGGHNYWFVLDYIALVLVTPLLNTIVDHTDQTTLRTSLIATYILIVPMDVVLKTDILGISGGYSVLWFVWLYLLARYVRIYGWDFMERNKWTAFAVCVILEAVLFYFGLLGTRYTNPLVLLPALSLVLIFKDYSFQSKFINYLAPATLIVYMLHMQPCLVPFIRRFLRGLYETNGFYLYIAEVLGLIVCLFAVSVAVYRFQAWLWAIIKQFNKNRICQQ